MPSSPNNAALSLKEEGVKILYRGDAPVAVYKQNGTLRFYKLIELSYGDLSEIYEPQIQV